MKSRFFFILFVLLNIPFFAFSQTISYTCVVFDSKTNKPLEGASIKDIKTLDAKITDASGKAVLKKSRSFDLAISFVGYDEKVVSINHSLYLSAQKDTVMLTFYLQKLSKTLAAVEVLETKGEGVLDKNKWLYDYELLDGDLWLLFNGNKKNRLIVIGSLGDTLVNTNIAENITRLEKAMGMYMMGLTNDSSFCIAKQDAGIKITERFSRKKYEREIEPLTLFHDYGIVKYVSPLNASVKFNMIHLQTKKAFCLSNYSNVDKANYNRSEVNAINGTNEYLEETNRGAMADLSIIDLKAVREVEQREWDLVFHHLVELSVYLFVVKDSLYIINMDNDSIYTFDSHGRFNNSFQSAFRKKNVHYSDLIVDEEHQCVYYKYVLRDVCYLEQIDLSTGKSVKTTALKRTYPEKIKIKSGVVYFMNDSKGLVESNNNLYLQPLQKN